MSRLSNTVNGNHAPKPLRKLKVNLFVINTLRETYSITHGLDEGTPGRVFRKFCAIDEHENQHHVGQNQAEFRTDWWGGISLGLLSWDRFKLQLLDYLARCVSPV